MEQVWNLMDSFTANVLSVPNNWHLGEKVYYSNINKRDVAESKPNTLLTLTYEIIHVPVAISLTS